MIVYCCPDLVFGSKIHSAAQALGIACRPARDAVALRNRLQQIDDGKLNEPVTGVIVDLGLGPAALEMIAQARQHHPAMPIVAYGSHLLTDLLARAREQGADFVMSNGQFAANLPDVLQRLKD